MISLERHGDVTAVHMWSRRSRLVGYSVRAFLLDGVLVDTGFPAVGRELSRLLDALRPRGVAVTHHHEDHAGNLELVARRGLPVAAADATLAAARAGEAGVGLYRRLVWSPMPRLVSPIAPLELAGLALVPTPGHSADHHVVWDGERRILFAGDLFLGVKVRVARPGEDPRALAASLRAAAALEPAVMFDAHRGPVPGPVGALRAKADWLDETIGRIDHMIGAGLPDGDVARAVLGREDFVNYFTFGDLARVNFVSALRRGARGQGPGAGGQLRAQ